MSTNPWAGIDDSVDEAPRPQPASNPSPVLPLVLLIDTSNSMNERVSGDDGGGRRLDHLISAVNRLFDELRQIGDARRGGEVAMLSFGGGGVQALDLRPAAESVGRAPAFVRLVDAAVPRDLVAHGATPLADALDAAANLVEERHRELRGRPRYRANVWILTDGENTDRAGYFLPLPPATIDRLRALESGRKLLVFCGALPGAAMEQLRRIAPHSTFPCKDAAFRDITKLIFFSSMEAGGAPDAPAETLYERVEEAFGRWSKRQ